MRVGEMAPRPTVSRRALQDSHAFGARLRREETVISLGYFVPKTIPLVSGRKVVAPGELIIAYDHSRTTWQERTALDRACMAGYLAENFTHADLPEGITVID